MVVSPKSPQNPGVEARPSSSDAGWIFRGFMAFIYNEHLGLPAETGV